MMDSGSEHFSSSGPSHLNSVDWNNAHHRRPVAACLVGCVYVLESDRQARRKGSQCLAPSRWEFFHFKLIHQLVDDDDNSIFGAIFEYNPSPYPYHRTIDRSPRYAIAFRGTLMKRDSFARDLDLDIDVIRNGLHQTTRFAIAIKAVRDVVFAVRGSNIWLTGHSLGAAMAMLAGKTMAKTGYFLEAFLFNPPFVSPSIEIIKDKKVRHGQARRKLAQEKAGRYWGRGYCEVNKPALTDKSIYECGGNERCGNFRTVASASFCKSDSESKSSTRYYACSWAIQVVEA